MLLLRWENDDLGVASELRRLENVFKEEFHYEVETWIIPSIKPTRPLQERLYKLQEVYKHENDLLIVCYAGHGDYDRRYTSIWRE